MCNVGTLRGKEVNGVSLASRPIRRYIELTPESPYNYHNDKLEYLHRREMLLPL